MLLRLSAVEQANMQMKNHHALEMKKLELKYQFEMHKVNAQVAIATSSGVSSDILNDDEDEVFDLDA